MISYLPTFMPNKVLIIGGGGTGGRLVPLLAQFLTTCKWIPNPEITIVDDDTVEEKNLLRQNFIAQDVGKPKAQVLAQRYSRAFNIPITPLISRIGPYTRHYPSGVGKETPEQLRHLEQSELFKKHSNNSIIILCVDSPEARRHIIGNIVVHVQGRDHNVLILDSGNENDFGQVSVSTGKTLQLGNTRSIVESWGNNLAGDLTIPQIPINVPYYRDMKSETTLSCADLDQTMAINCMMANVMFSIIQNFLYAKPIQFQRLNVSLSHGITPEYMNPRFLLDHSMEFNYVNLPGKFTEIGPLNLGFSEFGAEIGRFDREEVTPLKNAMLTSERAKKIEEAKAKGIYETKLKKLAVQEAMAENGWKYPEVEKDAEVPEKEQLKDLIAKDLEKFMAEDKDISARPAFKSRGIKRPTPVVNLDEVSL